MAGILNLEVAPPRPPGRPPLTAEAVEQRRRIEARKKAQQLLALTTNPVDQAREVFRKGGRLSALVGLILGGFVPLASYTLVHLEVATRPLLWVLVAGGLIYSAISVYAWARQAFGYRLKALGFVVLLEGTLTFCSVQWLSLAGLAILMVLNGVTAAVTLQTGIHTDAEDD